MWVVQAHLLNHVGLVLKWTCGALPFDEEVVGIGFWVLRAVLHASIPGHQSGLHPDLDLYLHLLMSWWSFLLWCVAEEDLY